MRYVSRGARLLHGLMSPIPYLHAMSITWLGCFNAESYGPYPCGGFTYPEVPWKDNLDLGYISNK